MIKSLAISNYVIITGLTVEFSDGLTVLTGETGAGKSILLDAMGMILGDDPDREAIRQGCPESAFEAVFLPPEKHPVWEFLGKLEGVSAPGPEFKIHRAFNRSDKDEILVNGAKVELPVLKELGAYLVEIHGQFANQNFLAPENQLTLLDLFGAYPPPILGNVKKAWDDINRITREAQEERAFFAISAPERPGIERLVMEVEKLAITKDSYGEMTTQLAYLIECRDICELFQTANAQLIAQTGIEMSLLRVERLMATQPDPALDPMKAHVASALAETRNAIAEMQKLAPRFMAIDTSSIPSMEKKLDAMRALAAEREVKPEDLFEHYEYLVKRLARIRNAPARIKELDGQLIRANEDYRRHATILSEERQKAAKRLGATITGEMPPLKLQSAQVQVEVTENTYERTARGFNQATFMARMNPGMPFSPIAKTASGGELARLILALKMILQQVQVVSTLVFDEIDTGIGGAAAAAVGSRIAKLAQTTQILVITHSPQVASRGMQHLHVSKATDGASTRTVVTQLSMEERIHEVSRMLAGEELTEQSKAAAKMLIDEARNSAAAAAAAAAAAKTKPGGGVSA